MVGVHRSLTVARQVLLPSELGARAVAVDVVIPTTEQTGFVHRIIGVYAPWDPGENPGQFWSSIADVCRSSSHSWSVHGDFNVSLTSIESISAPSHGHSPRDAYRTFLANTYAVDLWSLIPDRHYETHYTFRTLAANNNPESAFRARAIIDRVATSRVGIVSGDIATLDTFIPCTDHRPIISNIVLTPPDHGHANIPSEIPPLSYTPRFLYPRKTEGHLFEAFSSALDDRISQNPVIAQTDVVDDVT
ncbi:hypothetical protein H0H92_013905, partial [Tricholoma furcatifolium]